MDIIDVVVMVIVIVAFLYSLLSAFLIKKPPPQDYYEEEEEEEFEEKPEKPRYIPQTPPPPPPVAVKQTRQLPPHERFRKEKFEFETKMDDFYQKSPIEDRALKIDLGAPEELISDAVRLGEASKVIQRTQFTKMDAVMKALPSKKILWIAHEIVGPPVALRQFPLPWNK